MVEKMKTLFRTMVLGSLLALSANSYALSESEAEDMADLTAVFVFLKNDCGYQNLPNTQIRRALVFFAQQNQWDLSNYDSYNMKALGEDSYRDLSGINIPTAKNVKRWPAIRSACWLTSNNSRAGGNAPRLCISPPLNIYIYYCI
jgi:hypothetical protein